MILTALAYLTTFGLGAIVGIWACHTDHQPTSEEQS